MDYMTKPLSRIAIRHLSKYVRKIFELNESELFPVLEILEQTCIIFEGTEYSVLEDDKLPADVFAWCYPKPEGGFMIEIKQSMMVLVMIITELFCVSFVMKYVM